MILKDKRAQFVILFALIFTIIPMWCRNIIPHDMIENLYWGKEWQLGYEKHPPLFAWISWMFFRFCGSIPESMYILTQLNLLVGCVFIFKIAELIGQKKDECFSAVLFFLVSAAAVFGNTKFNATTILFSLLPIVFYFFLRMMKFQKISDAVCLGFFAMLACIGKYFALLFLGCMGLFLIFDPDCRKLLRTPLPYIALISFFVFISWHVVWLYQNNFISLQYGLEKSVTTVLHRRYAFVFLIMMMLFFGTSVLALFRCSKTHRVFDNCMSFYIRDRRIAQRYFQYTPEQRFVIMITLMPAFTMFFISLFIGMRIGSFWGVNMCMLIGIYFNILNNDIDHEKLFSFAKKITAVFAGIMFFQFSVPDKIWEISSPMRSLNARKLVQTIESSIDYRRIDVLHADKSTAFLHAYLGSSPTFYDVKNYKQFRPFDGYDRPGLHLVTFTPKFGGMEEIHKFENKFEDKIIKRGIFYIDYLYFGIYPFGKRTSPYKVYYAFIKVK